MKMAKQNSITIIDYWANKVKWLKNGLILHFTTSYFLHFPNSSLHMAKASLTALEESEILQSRTSPIRVAAIS